MENNYSVKNSYDFINAIKNIDIKSHYTLASFDIVNLYTNVPIQETLNIVKENLKKNLILLPEAIDELLELLNETLKQNYFTFNNKYYIQNEGLAMGSPLSGILSVL